MRPAEKESYCKDLPQNGQSTSVGRRYPGTCRAEALGLVASRWVTVDCHGPSRRHPTHPHPLRDPPHLRHIARPSAAAPLSSGHDTQTCPILQPRCSREGPSLTRRKLCMKTSMALNLAWPAARQGWRSKCSKYGKVYGTVAVNSVLTASLRDAIGFHGHVDSITLIASAVWTTPEARV